MVGKKDAGPAQPKRNYKPGILLVTSDTLVPSDLSRHAFDSWYIAHHVPLVLTTGKGQIGTATRYQHIPYSSALPSHPLDAPPSEADQLGFLTLYDLRDVGWVESDEFKSLENEYHGPFQASIFEHAVFDARCYSYVGEQCHNSATVISQESSAVPPAPIILTISLSHAPFNTEDDIQNWFQNDHLPFFDTVSGYRHSYLYQFNNRRLLERLDASYPDAPAWLIVHEFDGLRIPGIGFRDVEGEMARLKSKLVSKGKSRVDENLWKDEKMESKKEKMDFAFWSLMGEYWSKED
jgi:hypothetical protein